LWDCALLAIKMTAAATIKTIRPIVSASTHGIRSHGCTWCARVKTGLKKAYRDDR
jgi:hypothetical protein